LCLREGRPQGVASPKQPRQDPKTTQSSAIQAVPVKFETTPFQICHLETSHPDKSLLHPILGWNIEEKPEPRISDVSPEKAVGSSDTKESPTDDNICDDPDVCANLCVSPAPETSSDFPYSFGKNLCCLKISLKTQDEVLPL
jgi:hypothetical protein